MNDSDKNKENQNEIKNESTSRRSFITSLGLGLASISFLQSSCGTSKQTTISPTVDGKVIAGFDEVGKNTEDIHAGWTPVSNRKVKVGLVGYGLSTFSAAFGFQDHPNVEIMAVSDLNPTQCEKLAQRVRCNKKYPSLEEMVKDKTIEAIFICTDAPSHAKHAILALNHGKHVAVAVPAIFAKLDEAEELYNTVKRTGLKYMMFETSFYREDLYAMRKIYEAGGFGKIVYSEGEYIHYSSKPLPSYNGWRDGNAPMYYLTHATAYHICVTNGHFTEVSCYGKESHIAPYKGGKNRYNNPYASQVAMFRTDDGGYSRMAHLKDLPGKGAEIGRVRGELGMYERTIGYEGQKKDSLPNTKRPPLPPGVPPGGHGGSHGHLTEEFIRSILEDRHPLLDVAMALNLSIPGIVAHESCMKGGETLKIPHFKMWK